MSSLVFVSFETEKWPIVKSCSDLKKQNLTAESGNYVIDPDGEGGLPPFNVTCDMNDKNGVGVTVVSHDSENRTLVDGYEGAGSYKRDIIYTGANLSQLASLTSVSSHCEQFIKYECYGSLFVGINSGKQFGWWVSRDSTKMTYWGGAPIYQCFAFTVVTDDCHANSILVIHVTGDVKRWEASFTIRINEVIPTPRCRIQLS